jgi:hypothetical protein
MDKDTAVKLWEDTVGDSGAAPTDEELLDYARAVESTGTVSDASRIVKEVQELAASKREDAECLWRLIRIEAGTPLAEDLKKLARSLDDAALELEDILKGEG